MNNIVWCWETYFNVSNQTLSKIALVCTFVFCLVEFLRKRKRDKIQSNEGPIAEANARERHDWRYFWWSYQALKIVIAIYFIVTIVKFLFT
jgi:hypothetical protein